MVDSKRFYPGEDAEFRKYPPSPDADVLFIPPRIQETRLSNGLRVLLAERHDMPIVATQIVFDRGLDMQSGPGIATLMASILFAGTESRSALAVSDELEGLGARYSSWTDHDGMGVSGQCLRNQFVDLLSILADIVRHPSFDSTELEREKSKRLSTLTAQADDPDALLENALAERFYPPHHPFHAPLCGDEATIRAVQPQDLATLHRLVFRPAHATVTIAGDIDWETARQWVEKNFGSWTGEALPRQTFPELPSTYRSDKRIWLIDRSDAAQSNVLLGAMGIARSHPDYDAVMVLNTLLGGQFSSRLNLNLREKYAYTYGAFSIVEARIQPGPWTAGAAVTTPATADSIRQMLFEFERICQEPVPVAELQNAKTNLIRKLPARFETAASTAQALGALAVLHLPLDVFATRQSRAAQVSVEDVHRVANRYLRPENMHIFVVGDASVIRQDLEKLELGEIDVRSAAEANETISS